MGTGRLEAFSDGVLAIIITIMVLELRPPESGEFAALAPLAPVLAAYILSFIYVGLYWNNHHHMFQVTEWVSGAVLWANLHLLFWLSLVPFVTAWMGTNHFTAAPTAAYGVVLFMAAVAYFILERTIVAIQPDGSPLRSAVRGGAKEILSVVFYAAAIACASFQPRIAQAIYALVAISWLIPDRRIERLLRARPGPNG
jgi:uncharacterized membrane protein